MVDTKNIDELFNTLRTTEPYLEDDGFTSAIMARLPEAKELPAWLACLIQLGFTAIGSAIAAWILPVAEVVSFPAASRATALRL